MKHVLIGVYACRPDSGSEEGMGWNWVVNLARHCELHVINEGEWKEEIEAAVAKLEHRSNLHFYYLPVSEKVRRMCWNQGNWLFYFHYRQWQRRAYHKAMEIMQSHRIDIVHQLNFISFREPGYFWKITDRPFVWGPVGGMENMPVGYISGAGFSKKLFVIIKNLLNTLQVKFQPRVRKAMRRADLVIASGRGIETIIRREYGIEPVTINETGCYPPEKEDAARISAAGFNVVWVGKFDYRKQLGLALRTIAEVKHLPGISFHVVGTGNATDVEFYHRLSRELGLADIVVWHGRLNNKQVHELMRSAQLLFFTSIMEATSTVVVEAIMNNLPVLCFNTCGFGPIIDESVGCKVELSDPATSVRDFKEKMELLYTNREFLAKLSANCTQKSRGELAWPSKARRMTELYERVQPNKLE